jgi:hypothetical protein
LNRQDFTEARRLLGVGKDRVKVRTREAIARRGLSGASFVTAIRSLGFSDVDSVSPKSARINQAVKAQALRNSLGYSSVYSTEKATTVLMVNSSKVAIRRGAAGLVSGAIRIRAAFFRQNLKNAVFEDAKSILKSYPNAGIILDV